MQLGECCFVLVPQAKIVEKRVDSDDLFAFFAVRHHDSLHLTFVEFQQMLNFYRMNLSFDKVRMSCIVTAF